MADLPNQTSVVATVCLRRKLTFTAIFFCTPARSIRCIIQPEKRLRNERYKYHSAIYFYWSTRKTHEFPRHRCCLALNFGGNANHSYSHRFEPLTEPRVSSSTTAATKLYGLGAAEWPKYSNSCAGYKHKKDYLDRCTGSTNNMGVNVTW